MTDDTADLLRRAQATERRELSRAILGMVLIACVWVALAAAAATHLNKLKQETAFIEAQLRDARRELNAAQRQLADATNNLNLVNAQLARSQHDLEQLGREQLSPEQLAPSSVTIITADQGQAVKGLVARIRQKYHVDVRIGSLPASAAPPYTTEVRYYRYPNDLRIAQDVVLLLQNEFHDVLSRVSYVQDQTMAPKTIFIVLRNAAFRG